MMNSRQRMARSACHLHSVEAYMEELWASSMAFASKGRREGSFDMEPGSKLLVGFFEVWDRLLVWDWTDGSETG